MARHEKTYSGFAQTVTNRLLESVRSGDEIDPDLISYAEDVIQVHQLIVQLAFVGLIVDRLPQLANYNSALDNLVEQLDAHDLAEADISEKIRAASVINQSIKTTVDVINDMMASKDAVNMLIASMKDAFGKGTPLLEEGGASKNLINKFNTLSADKRQQLLAGVVTLIRNKMPEVIETEDEEDDE